MNMGERNSAALSFVLLIILASSLASNLMAQGGVGVAIMLEVDLMLESELPEGYSVWLVTPKSKIPVFEYGISHKGDNKTLLLDAADFNVTLYYRGVELDIEPEIYIINFSSTRLVFSDNETGQVLAIVEINVRVVTVTTTYTTQPVGMLQITLLEARVSNFSIVELPSGKALLRDSDVGRSVAWSGDPLVGLGVIIGDNVYILGSNSFTYYDIGCMRVYEMDADSDGVYGDIRIGIRPLFCPNTTTTTPPQKGITVIHPRDGDIVRSTSVVFRWVTAEPVQSRLEVRSVSTSMVFDTEAGTTHSVMVDGLEPGKSYDFMIIAGNESTGWLSFTVAEGLLLGIDGVTARIAADYGQYVPVPVKNFGSQPVTFKAGIRGLPPGVVGGFIGEGSGEVTLAPGEGKELILGLHAPGAEPGNYTVEVYLVSGGEEVASSRIFLEIVGLEPLIRATYSRSGVGGVLDVVNVGVTPVNNISVSLGEGLEGKAIIDPYPASFRLMPGEGARFKIYPILHEGFTSVSGVIRVSYPGGEKVVGAELGLSDGQRVELIDPLDYVDIRPFDPLKGDYYTTPSGVIEPLQFQDGTVAAPVSLGFKVVIELGNESWALSEFPVVIDLVGESSDGTVINESGLTRTGPSGVAQLYAFLTPGSYSYRARVPGTQIRTEWIEVSVAREPIASIAEDPDLRLQLVGGQDGGAITVTAENHVLEVNNWSPGLSGILVLYKDGIPVRAMELVNGEADLAGIAWGEYTALVVVSDGDRIRYSEQVISVDPSAWFLPFNQTRVGVDWRGRMYVLDQVSDSSIPARVEAAYVIGDGNVSRVYLWVASEEYGTVTLAARGGGEHYTVEAGPSQRLVGPFTAVGGNFSIVIDVSSLGGSGSVSVTHKVFESVDPSATDILAGMMAGLKIALDHPVTNFALSCIPGLTCGFNSVITGLKLGMGSAGLTDVMLTLLDCAKLIPEPVGLAIMAYQCASSVPPLFAWLINLVCSDTFCVNIGVHAPNCPFGYPGPLSPSQGPGAPPPPLPQPPGSRPWFSSDPEPPCSDYCDRYEEESIECSHGNVTACFEAVKYYSLCYVCGLGSSEYPEGLLSINIVPELRSSELYEQQVIIGGRAVATRDLMSMPGPVFFPLTHNDLEVLGPGSLVIVNERISPGEFKFVTQISEKALAYPLPFYAVVGGGETAEEAVAERMMKGPDLSIASGNAVVDGETIRFQIWNQGSYTPYAVIKVSSGGAEELITVPGIPPMSMRWVSVNLSGLGDNVTIWVDAPGEVNEVDNYVVLPIGMNLPPTARFSTEDLGEGTYGFVSESVDDGEIAAQAWDLGDGTLTSGERVIHRYLMNGSFVVSLHVMDDYGEIDIATTTVYVGALPTTSVTTATTTTTQSTQATTAHTTPTQATTQTTPTHVTPAPPSPEGIPATMVAAAAAAVVGAVAVLLILRKRR